MNWRRFAQSILIFSLLALPAMAATFIVPDDETFIRKADLIITGTVLDSYVRYADGNGIETVYRIAVDEVLKGQVDESVLELREWGGVIGSRFMVMSGAPHYEIGERYLIFMTPFRDGRLTTLDLALGQFRFVEHQGQQILERDRSEIIDLSERGLPFERPATRFIQKIREQVASEGVGIQSDLTVTPQANDLDTAQAAAVGAGAWSGGTTVSYSVSGTPASGDIKDTGDGEERIIIDDPHGDIAGTFTGSGTVATAFFGGLIRTDRIDIDGSDIVVQDGVNSSNMSQGNYNTTMTHEMGHTLGFRHSNQNKYSQSGTSCSAPLPCSTSAVMNSSIVGGLNGNLQPWDVDAVTKNYGSSPDADYLIIDSGSEKPWYRNNPSVAWRITAQCTGPTITAQPAAVTITAGQTATLSVSATAGTGSLSYQWYRGNSGSTNNPISGATGSSVQVSPTVSTNYWVRVTDGCSSINSNTATVTVEEGCGGPTITQQPTASPSTITEGESSTLSVSASASEGTLSYQWYIGSSGQTGNPVAGGTTASIVVSPTSSTSYWVRVTDACNGGTSTNSNTVTVTVNACEPVITQQPFDKTITAGQTATLSISVSNATGVQWYRGSAGDTTTPLGTGTSIKVSPTSTTKYWARVSNSCASVDSRTVTVNVEECQPPQFTSQPADTSVESGKSAVLSVGVSGSSPISVTWYRGERNDTSSQVGTGTSITVSPSSTTKYWARANNACGSASSLAATVTVVGACEAPQITQQPQDQKIQAGETATLSVVATGTTLSYQWYLAQGGDFIPVEGATASTFTTPPLAASARYLVQITNSCGQVNSDLVLVEVSQCSEPTITSQPQSVSVRGGERVVLSVTATGTGPLSYQWFEGQSGTPSTRINGATSRTLEIAKASETKSYWVRVTNECGEINSATATVTVENMRRRSVRRP